MTRRFAYAALFSTLLGAVGCSSSKTYDVIVTNRLDETVTLWLTRANEPYEQGWVPPEVMAIGTTGSDPQGGVVLHAGVAAEAKLKGKDDPDNAAILRVYRSTNMNAILAMSRGNPGRLDYILTPGRTDLDVMVEGGEMKLLPHVTAAPAK